MSIHANIAHTHVGIIVRKHGFLRLGKAFRLKTSAFLLILLQEQRACDLSFLQFWGDTWHVPEPNHVHIMLSAHIPPIHIVWFDNLHLRRAISVLEPPSPGINCPKDGWLPWPEGVSMTSALKGDGCLAALVFVAHSVSRQVVIPDSKAVQSGTWAVRGCLFFVFVVLEQCENQSTHWR